MALVPCKVCGALNSENAEICLSCGYPTRGKKRPALFQAAAILVVLLLALPVLLGLLLRFQPRRPNQLPPDPGATAQFSQITSQIKRNA